MTEKQDDYDNPWKDILTKYFKELGAPFIHWLTLFQSISSFTGNFLKKVSIIF